MPKTRSQIASEIEGDIPSGGNRKITAVILRGLLNDISLAAPNIQDGETGTGNVNGPSSAVDGRVVIFDSTSGKLLKDAGAVALSGVAASGGSSDAGKLPLLGSNGLLDPSFVAANVVGPASVTDGHIAVFDGVTGKLLKDINVVVLVGVMTSAGAADVGKIPLLNASGKLDASFLP
jgi:hypothetical protein